MITGQEIYKHFEGRFLKYSNIDKIFTSISTDSRTCEKGSLFVSLEKSKVNAHKYARDAVARGSVGILSQHDFQFEEIGSFVADNIDQIFYLLSGLWRKKFNIPVIAVAGNVGKTTTKEMVAYLLELSGKKVLKTEQSQNGFQGIPATLIRLNSHHDVAVIEIGIDAPDTMAQHAMLVKPTNIVIPSLGVEHLDELKHPDNAAREEFELVLWGAQNGASIVLNGDNEYCQNLANTYLKNKDFAFFSLGSSSKDRFENKLRCLGSCEENSLRVSDLAEGKSFLLALDLPGIHNVSNLLGAATTLLSMGIDLTFIQGSSQKFNLAIGRSEIRVGAKGATFLCDYYNASPASMAAAFTTILDLKKSKPLGKVWLCLGDMLGLGSEEEFYHRQLAQMLPAGANLLSYGNRMIWTQDQLEKMKSPIPRKHFANLVEVANALYNSISPTDLVLIKGSRGMAMEGVWHELVKLESQKSMDLR